MVAMKEKISVEAIEFYPNRAENFHERVLTHVRLMIGEVALEIKNVCYKVTSACVAKIRIQMCAQIFLHVQSAKTTRIFAT